MAIKGQHWTDKEREAHSGNPQGWIDTVDGYWRFKIGRKQFLLHRYIMEQHLGRPLLRSEAVHHINGDRSDNRIDNLRILSLGEHTILHSTGSKRTPESCAKMSAAAKGRIRSEEAKRKTSESLREHWRKKRENVM
jgi:hypothetical protein